MLRNAEFTQPETVRARGSGGGHPFSGTWEAWLAPNVLLATLLSPHVPCRRPEIGFVFRVDSALFRAKSQYANDLHHEQLASFWRFSLTTGSLSSDSLATILPPLATTSYDPPPLATACHRPPNCQKPNGPDLDERVLYFSMSPKQAIFTDKTICSSPLAAAHPLTVLSWPRRSTPVCSGVPAGWP